MTAMEFFLENLTTDTVFREPVKGNSVLLTEAVNVEYSISP